MHAGCRVKTAHRRVTPPAASDGPQQCKGPLAGGSGSLHHRLAAAAEGALVAAPHTRTAMPSKPATATAALRRSLRQVASGARRARHSHHRGALRGGRLPGQLRHAISSVRVRAFRPGPPSQNPLPLVL